MGSLHQVMKLIRTILCLALAGTASAASLNEGTRFWNWCWWCSTGISEDLNDLDLILYTYGNPSWTFKLDADSQDLLSNVGKAAYEFSNQKIARVTGLDVAQQYFDSHLSEDTIRPDDAKLVDIMHTDSGDVGAAASTMEPIGMVDFYPNGGGMMAGCEWSFWASACNHMKTLDYYVDSVINRKNSDYMASTKCESYEEFQAGNCDQMEKLPMGEALTLDMVSGNGPMKFYLNTNANYPFGQ